jgi:hypothetical protein
MNRVINAKSPGKSQIAVWAGDVAIRNEVWPDLALLEVAQEDAVHLSRKAAC